MESNDSPEIPDRGETSDIPGLPSGQQKYFFHFKYELHRVQPCWFVLYQWRAEKGCPVMLRTLLPDMLAVFLMSQTVRPKMEMLMAVFTQLSNIDY